MRDATGADIVLGTPTVFQPIGDGNNTLLFGAFLKGATAADTVVPGEFTAITNFSLAYQ